ncbi:MAG: type III pantothenate kinase [Neomegalonema sp.]|nr:type III pantothenate kinase [Neomegalonema sp.]
MSSALAPIISLIDIGNSNIVVAVARGDRILKRFRLPTEPKWTGDFYEITLRSLIAGASEFAASSAVVLASTVPALTDRVADAAGRVFGRDVLVLNRHRCALGIEIDIDAPKDAGVDRLVNALAAKAYYGAPAIVVDIGTGTTFDVVGQSGAYVGGAIAAGPALSLESLHRVAAQLPKIEIVRPERVIGRSTLGAMQSGFYWAYVGMIQFMCGKIAAELGSDLSSTHVIVSGGYAAAFRDSFDMRCQLDQDITLRGMLLAHRQLTSGG